MTKRRKILIILSVLAVSAAVAFYLFSPAREIEKRITEALAAQGLSAPSVAISSIDSSHITFSHIAFAKEAMQVKAEGLTLKAASLNYVELLQGKLSNLSGDWKVESLSVEGAPYPVPALSGNGTWAFKDNAPHVEGTLASEDKSHSAVFTITPKDISLQQIAMPWEGAKLSAQDIHIALGEQKPVHIKLHVKHMPLTTLLMMMTSNKASGTGDVSGTLPMTIAPDGTITLGVGKLATEQSGMITLSADALPGDAPQIEMARTALTNFHYSDLSLTTENDNKGRAIIRLTLEGNNPEAFEGRPIKLTVNLSGDVLETLQSTLQLMNDPQKWIEQENK